MSAMVPGGFGCPECTRRWPSRSQGGPGAGSLRPLEPPEVYKAVLRRVRGLDGRIRSTPWRLVDRQPCCRRRYGTDLQQPYRSQPWQTVADPTTCA